MAPRVLLLLLLLLTPQLRGSAARPAPRRASRHSDGTFTSELSRLRERVRLQRLLQGLVGKRSEQDTEHRLSWSESPEGPVCLLWSHKPALRAWVPTAPPSRRGLVILAASPTEASARGSRPCCAC